MLSRPRAPDEAFLERPFTLIMMRLFSLLSAIVVLLLFAALNAIPAELPTQGGLRLILQAQAISLPMLLFPVILGIVAEPARVRQWFAVRGWRVWRALGVGFPLLLVGCEGLLSVINPAEEQAMVRLIQSMGIGERALVGLIVCGAVPLAEELLCRGVVLGALPLRWGLPISSLLFACAHGLDGYVLPLFLMGWCLGLITHCTRSLLPAILLHGGFNLLTLLLI